MGYIGKEPQQGNYLVLDAITASSTNTYNLLNGGVAFTPESANHMIVSLNGVIQAPNTAFSVSGSTITFLPSSGTLSSSDSIDFIMVLGNVLDIGTPSDNTVTNAKTNFTTTSSNAGLQIKGDGTTAGALQLNCEQNSHGIKLQSPAHSANQSYTLKFPTGNVTADKVLKVASVTGSGTTGVGQLSFGDAGGATTLTEVATTSGSYQDITVPTTAKIIYVGMLGFSHSGSNANHEIQLGTASGIVTSGYLGIATYSGGGHNSGGANVTMTDSFPFVYLSGQSTTVYGLMTIVSMGGNKWVYNSAMNTGSYQNHGAGYVALGGAITTVRIQTDTNGTTLDAGAFNVTYIE